MISWLLLCFYTITYFLIIDKKHERFETRGLYVSLVARQKTHLPGAPENGK
jgi:hypothetical protein